MILLISPLHASAEPLREALRHYAQGRPHACAAAIRSPRSPSHLYWKARCLEEPLGRPVPAARQALRRLRQYHPTAYYTYLTRHPQAPARAGRAGTAEAFQALFQAMERAESAGNPRAVSRAGARGLMQIMPATARHFGASPERLFEPAYNRRTSRIILRNYARQCSWDVVCTLYAYNAGPSRALRWKRTRPRNPVQGIEQIPIRETREYVQRILRFTWNRQPNARSRHDLTTGRWPGRP